LADPLALRRRFARLTAINILSNLTVPMAGLVDTALLGHLPDIRFLAGVALASLLFDYVYWSFGFLRMGTTGTTAQAVGRGETAETYRVLYRSLLLAAALGTLLLLLQRPLADLGFSLLSGEPPVEAAGRDYFFARILAAPATLANFAFLGWYLGREESGRALAMSAVANVVNVGLNWVFIVELGWASRGAGLATAASQYAMLATALGLLWRAVRRDHALAAADDVDRAGAGDARPGSTEPGGAGSAAYPRAGGLARWLPGWRRHAVFDRGKLLDLVRLNTDILVRTLCLTTAFALFMNFSSLLGTAVLAANAILIRLFYLAAYSIDGAAFATESLAGILRGAGEGGALRRLHRLAHATGLGFTALFLASYFAVPRQVMALLTNHHDVAARAMALAPWLIPVLLAGTAAFIYDGLFLGLTAGRALRNSMLVSTFVVFLPVAALALHLESNPGLWLAFSLFMAARAGTLGWASRRLLAG
jgi:MATE family multidrug resistance protein